MDLGCLPYTMLYGTTACVSVVNGSEKGDVGIRPRWVVDLLEDAMLLSEHRLLPLVVREGSGQRGVCPIRLL